MSLSIFQQIRRLDMDVWLFIYSILILPCDFSVLRKVISDIFPDVELLMAFGFVAGALFVIWAAWSRNRIALILAYGYTSLVVALITITSMHLFYTSKQIKEGYPETLRKILKHNTSEILTDWQRIGYPVYFQLSVIQIAFFAIFQSLYIEKTLKFLKKSTSSKNSMLQKLKAIDIRVWFAFWSLFGYSQTVQLFEPLIIDGFNSETGFYLGAWLLGLVTVYAAFSNRKWALKFTKFVTIFYLLICGAAFIAGPVFLYDQLGHLDIHPDTHPDILRNLIVPTIVSELIIAFAMCICGLQLALVLFVIKKIDKENNKADITLNNFV